MQRGGSRASGRTGRPQRPGALSRGGKVGGASAGAAPWPGGPGRGSERRRGKPGSGWGWSALVGASSRRDTECGARAREHLLVLSPKAWSGALSCDWPTGRPSRVAETRADWATAATFSSHLCRCLPRPPPARRCAPSPGEAQERRPEGKDPCLSLLCVSRFPTVILSLPLSAPSVSGYSDFILSSSPS